MHPVQEYFLEDCIQITNFMPEAIQKKKNKNKNNKDDEDEVMEEEDKTLDRTAGPGYSPAVQKAMNEIGDSGDVPFDLISALLEYINTLNVPGAVLVFLLSWSQIFALLKYLQQHPEFGSGNWQVPPDSSSLPAAQGGSESRV